MVLSIVSRKTGVAKNQTNKQTKNEKTLNFFSYHPPCYLNTVLFRLVFSAPAFNQRPCSLYFGF